MWTATGGLLATGTFTNETANGWQLLNFSTPIAIAANTTYVASYHTQSSYYQSSNNFQFVGADQTPLHALKDGIEGPNGVYGYGPGGIFPNQAYLSSNFWADVVFIPTIIQGSAFSDTTPPVISSITVTSITATSAFVNWNSDEPGDGLVGFYEPCPPSGCATPLFPTLTTSPRVALKGLSPGATYTYRIMTKDSVGNVAYSADQTFTTMPAGFTTYSMWTNTTIPATESTADNRAIDVGVKFKSDVDGVISAIRF